MADLPEGFVCHATAERLRIKVPDRRHDAAFFDRVRERLSGWRSVERVEVNPLTASILVHYTDPTELYAENLAANDMFRVVYPETANGNGEADPVTWLQQVQAMLQGADKRVQGWLGPRADLRIVMIAALVLAAAHQTLRGNVTAPAATLLWYALRLTGYAGAVQREAGAD